MLSDLKYLELINKTIDETIIQYALPVYNYDNLDLINKAEIQFTINDQLFLETLLIQIRGKTISYATHKKKTMNRKENTLIGEINDLEKSVNEKTIDDLNLKKKELQDIREIKLQAKIIRSRVEWILKGEKPTNFFCQLENHNFLNKIIYKLVNEEDDVITNQKEILKAVQTFYEKLYSVNPNIEDLNNNVYLDNIDIPKLSYSESEEIEGLITYEEASNTLKKMKNNKTPGSDGFPAEFYKCFWKKLGIFVVRSINYGYVNDELSITQKHGIITCLPKGDKPKQYLKNWRPLTLLNTVYKIASGSISNRIKTVLNKIISEDQTGFISGRYIGENTRLVYDIMDYTECNNIPGLLLLIDFEKAFDTIDWNFIQKCLNIFNFGKSIQKWVKVFQNNIYSTINQGGNFSDKIEIHRGCRQGDPIASQIFIICAEILALKIRSNNNISGIKINDREIKLSQFADDTTLILDGTEKSLLSSMTEISKFGAISGLKINFSKTQVIWIGSKTYSSDKLCSGYKLQWGITRFNLLGIDFDVNLHIIPKINFDKKLVKLKLIINNWKRRNLTPIRRNTIFKTLIISQINHLLIALPNPDEKFLKELNNLMFKFIWNDKPDKIRRDISILNYDNGGIKILDIDNYINSLKSTWLRKYLCGNGKWKHVLEKEVNMDIIINSGTKGIEEAQKRMHNNFWIDVFKSWKKIIEAYKLNQEINVLLQPIWHNDILMIGNKTLFINQWYKKGVRYINDLVNENNQFYNHNQFQINYNIRTDFLTYYGIINSVRKFVKNEDLLYSKEIYYPIIPMNIQIFYKNRSGARDLYNIVYFSKAKRLPPAAQKWNQLLHLDDIQWELIYKLPFTITTNTKLQWFQVRINHSILGTNWLLNKINSNTNPNCSFCSKEIETIEHIFWECNIVKILLQQFQYSINKYNIGFNMSKNKFILGQYIKENNHKTKNMISIWIKYYIYKTKLKKQNLTVIALKNQLKQFYQTEKYQQISEGLAQQFLNDWDIWIPYMES